MRTRAYSRTFIARTKQAALIHHVKGKELIDCCFDVAGDQLNTRTVTRFLQAFFAYKELAEQSIRTVSDISQEDQAIIVTCSLQTVTDRFKEKYSIDDCGLMRF